MKKSIIISLYKFLRFFTTVTFDFIFSLSLFMGVAYLFESLNVAIFMLVSHFFIFKYLNPVIRKSCKTDLSYDEYTNAIDKIKSK